MMRIAVQVDAVLAQDGTDTVLPIVLKGNHAILA